MFAELFVQVLRLCRAAGMVKPATVAIDGTKIAANASPTANRSATWLAAEAAKMDQQAAERAERETVDGILAQAQEVDAAEDAVFGVARGDELPAGWSGRQGRRERIRAAQARLAAAEELKRAQEQQAAAARAERDAAALANAEAAPAAERDRQQAKIEAWERAPSSPASGTSKNFAPASSAAAWPPSPAKSSSPLPCSTSSNSTEPTVDRSDGLSWRDVQLGGRC
ncbi:MAG TPA: hypothetical protein VFN75_01565, partial [Pseudonocardiaceae bacterium]|nr:hypothetical protein [Pseudonocardiaceae bacterium]